jgi:MFS family permease
MFLGFSVGTALAPNLASFFIFRILTAFQGTAFLIVGAACIGDIFRPVSTAPIGLLNHANTFTD